MKLKLAILSQDEVDSILENLGNGHQVIQYKLQNDSSLQFFFQPSVTSYSHHDDVMCICDVILTSYFVCNVTLTPILRYLVFVTSYWHHQHHRSFQANLFVISNICINNDHPFITKLITWNLVNRRRFLTQLWQLIIYHYFHNKQKTGVKLSLGANDIC